VNAKAAKPAPDAEAGADAGMTIDELAATAGVPTRTIRFYQSKGVLAPPERSGRVGRYDAGHLERLRLVGDLQDRGLQLSAIAELLQRAGDSRESIAEWLGVSDSLRSPWAEDSPRLFTSDEMTAHVGSHPGLLAQLVKAGLAERNDATKPAAFLVPSPAMLDLVLRLHEAGVDVDVAARSVKILRKRLGKAADDLAELFLAEAGDGFGTSNKAAAFAATLDAVRPIGVDLARLIFSQEMTRALTKLVEAGKVGGLS